MNNFEDMSTAASLIESVNDSAKGLETKLANNSEIAANSQVGFDPEKLVPATTYVEAGIERLTVMCEALGLEAKTAQAIEIFRGMTTSWGDKQVGDISGWRSDVSDDGAPFEFSIAFKEDRAELRFLLEARGSNEDLESNWQAGLELNQYLANNFGVSLDRFQQIQDLFAPHNSEAKLAIWHAVCIYPDKEPSFKLYLNPQAQGASKAAAVVEESLVRLGFTHAWMGLAETAAQRGPDRDDFIYFSLDLAADAKARVKVYLRHFDATPTELDAALSLANNYVAGDAIEFCQTMAPDRASFSAKPATTCFAWVESDNATPSGSTLYLPIGYYVTDDRVVSDRLDNYFCQHNLPVSRYYSALQAQAKRPLNAGVGMHSYVALSSSEKQHRVMVYLNPEVNEIRATGVSEKEVVGLLPSIDLTANKYQINSIGEHPFLNRLQRESVSLKNLWLLFANGKEGIVSHFTRRLASVVGRIDNEHIRCILTKQLNEELGNGDINHVHRKLFDRLILALDPYKPQSIDDKMLSPGRELSQSLEEVYANLNPYVGVGAAIVMEIRGKQIDEVMGKEFVTRTTVDRASLSWLHLHEELEIDHADEAIELAHIILESNGDKEAALQGAAMTADALWTFFNGMYRVCYA